MDKKELYQYVGSMQQMAYIRKVTCEEGRSTGLRMFDVKNECLQDVYKRQPQVRGKISFAPEIIL